MENSLIVREKEYMFTGRKGFAINQHSAFLICFLRCEVFSFIVFSRTVSTGIEKYSDKNSDKKFMDKESEFLNQRC